MKRILGLLIVISLISTMMISCIKKEDKNLVFKEQGKQDASNFKNEYEKLNSQKNEEGYFKYQSLNIDSDNLIVYLNYEELVEFFEKGTGVFYFGRPGCSWCRNLINTLLDFSWYNKENIYYYNVEEIRNENNDEYKNLLTILNEYLPVDIITQKEDSKKFDKNLKRIVLPYIFFVKDGKVKTYYNGYQDPNLKNNNYDEIEKIFNKNYELIK